ncbi:MAG: hypothetical protein WA840_00340 [Caulobacteraceae bacterium]
MHRTLGLALAVLSAALVAGCETTGEGGLGGPANVAPPPPPPPPGPTAGFDPMEFAWSSAPGPDAVIGHVQYHAVSGALWTCTGQTIALIPRTRYSAARMRSLYGSDDHAVVPVGVVKAHDAARPGVDYGRFVRTAACDSHNGFVFDHLPDGGFFIIARAVPHGQVAGPNEGVVVMQRIEVHNGAALKITLPIAGR